MASRELPAGRVTLLFTDIEGSTALIEELGESGYVEALAEHRLLLRAAFSAHGGVEVDTQGDAFLYAFAGPVEALAAAAEGQKALASGEVKVRMGLHTGELQLTGEGYAGRELHRAARIAGSGHGGQVVLSAATRVLVDGELIELGEHRLKDFDEPVALFQLGSARFPPLRTISNTNLPRPVSSFVGRKREREELLALLRNGSRLVTLSGSGGSGKTRLALEVASELVGDFKAGVFWVGLTALRDPALVTDTMAQTLGAKDGLAEHVGERELLLLLDNFEQVVEAAPELSQLLQGCPNLRLLVTSRELLRIAGEVDYPVPSLAEPEAVELFCERSRLDADETIAELCRRLDDLPLAVELAAARARVLTPAQILDRLSQRLDLLTGGRDADPRQQTLRATIAWSHDLLDDEERKLFTRLAVFRGGCTLEAAEEVASADVDTLQSLVDKSLLRRTDERFWMLETIREYALERLAESGAEAELRGRYVAYFLQLAEQADREIEDGAVISEALARVAADHDNFRSALEWARDHAESEILLRLAAALASYWRLRAFYGEAHSWQQLALERASSPSAARIRVLRASGMRALDERDFARADALLAEHRRAAEEAGDEDELLSAMNSAAHLAYYQGDTETARKEWLELKERAAEIGDRQTQAKMTVNVGLAAWGSGDYRTSLECSLEAADLFRELGEETGTVVALLNLGWSAFVLGDSALAVESLREAVVVAGRLGAIHWIANGALALGATFTAEHEEERGTQFLAAAASLREEVGRGFNDAVEERTHERAVADAKAALGDEAFADAWARGQVMEPDEIVKFCEVETDQAAQRAIPSSDP